MLFGRTSAGEGRWTWLLLGVMLAGGCANLVAALAQVWVSGAAQSFWFAASDVVEQTGRAGGYLRQSNQLASMFLLALISVAVLVSRARATSAAAAAGLALLATLFGMGLAVTSSRAGMLGLIVVAGLMLLDREWPRVARYLPLWACVGLGAGLVVNPLLGHVPDGSELTRGASGAMRWTLWSDTLGIIRDHPWTGVGWGQFSFVWALTPNPARVPEAFGHAHNLVLHLCAEIGIPLTAGVLGALAWAFWSGRTALAHPDRRARLQARAAYLTWAVLLVHSIFEYPLWYPYFLLPAAYLLGLILHLGAQARARSVRPDCASGPAALVRALGVLMVLGALFATWDYSRQIQVYSPFGAAGFQPLERRIQLARQSVLFGAFADFAAISVAPRPDRLFDAFDRPLHYGINGELLVAYSRALHGRGDDARATYVAQRAREFTGPAVDAFFRPCQEPDSVRPYQCNDTPVGLSPLDFQ